MTKQIFVTGKKTFIYFYLKRNLFSAHAFDGVFYHRLGFGGISFIGFHGGLKFFYGGCNLLNGGGQFQNPF